MGSQVFGMVGELAKYNGDTFKLIHLIQQFNVICNCRQNYSHGKIFIFSTIKCAAMCTALSMCDGFSQGDDEPCNLKEAVSGGSSANNYTVYKRVP